MACKPTAVDWPLPQLWTWESKPEFLLYTDNYNEMHKPLAQRMRLKAPLLLMDDEMQSTFSISAWLTFGGPLKWNSPPSIIITYVVAPRVPWNEENSLLRLEKVIQNGEYFTVPILSIKWKALSANPRRTTRSSKYDWLGFFSTHGEIML